MADIEDVMRALGEVVATSVADTGPCIVYIGNPHPQELEQAMLAKTVHISIFPYGSGEKRSAVPISAPQVIADPVIVLTATVSGEQFEGGAVGVAAAGTIEFGDEVGTGAMLLLYVNNQLDHNPLYVDYQPADGISPEELATAFTALINDTDGVSDLLVATVDEKTITLTAAATGEDGNAIEFWTRIGGTGTVAQKVRQHQSLISVTVWAYDNPSRVAFCKAIDGVLADTKFLEASDTSQARLTYERFDQTDIEVRLGVYRRSLVYRAEYNTITTTEAYSVLETAITLVVRQLTYDVTVEPIESEENVLGSIEVVSGDAADS